MKNRRRIIFINLHGNEFLVKTLNKILFGQSVAIKHKYFLDYLLERDDIEVCSFITKRGLSLSYTTENPILQSFRFIENKFVLYKNGLLNKKIKVLNKIDNILPNDILICYSYYGQTQLCLKKWPECIRVISQIHFNTISSELERNFQPIAMYNESNLQKYSGMWRRDLAWFDKEFITIPFVFEPRFKNSVPFKKRKPKAVSVGTITYMHNITEYYGDPCAQPSRKICRELSLEHSDLIDSFNYDYNEDKQNDSLTPTKNPFVKTYRRIHSKITGGHQNKYYSFNMVDKLNNYQIAVVGEEIMGIPGIGFVEAMACGCAYIGQTIGYYEEYGMIEGIHYIGYDGSKNDLIKKLQFWQRPENQQRLEEIAKNGYHFVIDNFCKDKVASELTNKLLSLKQ